MQRSVSVFYATAETDGKPTHFYCLQPNKNMPPTGEPGRWEYMTDITLRDGEEWTELFAWDSGIPEPGFSVRSKTDEEMPKETNESLRDLLVHTPHEIDRLYVFELKAEKEKAYRKDGKPVIVDVMAFTDDAEGKCLPTTMGKWKLIHHFSRDEAVHWKSEIIRAIKKTGYGLLEKEREIKEDKEPLYFFFNKSEPEKVRDEGEKAIWRTRVAFTTDIFGENLPVWFRKNSQFGAYPETMDRPEWDLKAIRKKLETEDYILDYLQMEIPKTKRASTPEMKSAADPIVKPAAPVATVSDPMVTSFADKIWEKLKK